MSFHRDIFSNHAWRKYLYTAVRKRRWDVLAHQTGIEPVYYGFGDQAISNYLY